MTYCTDNFILLFLTILSVFFITPNYVSSINVVSYGAKPNDKFDSTIPFQKAWFSACKSKDPATIYVPKGSFLLKQVTFKGPCTNNINFQIDGNITAPLDSSSHGNSGSWIMFRELDGLSIQGGTLNGNGDNYWSCKKAGNCPAGARSISFSSCKNVKVSGLTSLNSEAAHITVDHCKDIMFQHLEINAPETSPNTDGIDVIFSSDVIVNHSTISTGDDCIALIQGTNNVSIDHITCGPGHGIGIGSLGTSNDEAGVENVRVMNSIFKGTQNGVRIKSWAQPSNEYARDIVFKNLTMDNVQNPIIIDQNYCTGSNNCPNKSSGVKISNVSFEQIKGTSATPQAIQLDCSDTNPCQDIKLHDIHLIYTKGSATSTCKNANVITSGVVIPKSCL
ncbi:hypothetical protein VNO78_03161 [Psophocarpus tetragonolobus]|uniref:Polygalacturonase n=1 Tax=Psophocarpus tetragonolobus TaxID=3891 RepID=A0AAN9T0N2_PSOTE